MSRRILIQIDLEEAIHTRLSELAVEQGCSVSELANDALRRSYGAGRLDERRVTLEKIHGIWSDRIDLNSQEYLGRLR